MIKISKSKFKPRAFELFRLVEERRETLVITDRGKPVLKVVPFEEDDEADLAALRGVLVRYDDPLEPVGEAEWEADR
jgi:prevent-host-death family protein